jgi:hypothetical protein
MDKAIRPCGGGWQYCDGNCATCNFTNMEYGTTTGPVEGAGHATSTDYDTLSKPTEEQYEASKQARSTFCDWVRTSRKRQTFLIDELSKERALEKEYQEMCDLHKDIVRRYEIYEEIEASG